MPPPPPLTAQEAAQELRCHERTVRRMIGRGQIRARLVAGRYLIAREDLPEPEVITRHTPPVRRPRPLPLADGGGRYRAIAAQLQGAR